MGEDDPNFFLKDLMNVVLVDVVIFRQEFCCPGSVFLDFFVGSDILAFENVFLEKFQLFFQSRTASKAKPENDEKDKSRFSVETPFETRYFTVTVDENGEVTDCDLDRIAAVDEETAEEYTQTAQQKNKTTGFQGIYRYRVTETEDGAKYVFLLVVIFSRMVFRPVEESIQKQKRFIKDASHELKTPLTIIDANTEVMEMESGESQYHGREQKWQRINDYRYLIKKDQRRKNTRWTNCPPGIFSFY